MNDKIRAKVLVVLIFTLMAMSFGTACGTTHIGENISKEIIPTSLTESKEKISVIDENYFEVKNITLKNKTIKDEKENKNNTFENIIYDNSTENNTNITNNTTNNTNITLNNTELDENITLSTINETIIKPISEIIPI